MRILKYSLLTGLLFTAMVVKSQDTTVVQTINYESTTRDTLIEFPDGTEQYEQILMLYSMRCKDALVSDGGNRNKGCGEWDYSCNTYITDSTKIDSLRATTTDFIIPAFSGSSFNYTNQALVNTHQRRLTESLITKIISEDTSTVDLHLNSTSFLSSKSSGRSLVLFTAQELRSAGLIAGEIDGLLSEVLQGGNLQFFTVGMQHVTMDSLGNALVLEGFTNVFRDHHKFNLGFDRMSFHTPFIWDGVSDLLLDFNFNSQYTSTDIQLKSGELDTVRTVDAWHSNACYLDGATYIQANSFKGILGTDARSMGAWIKTTNANGEMVSYGKDAGGEKWVFRINGDGAIRVEVNGGSIVGSTNVLDDEWHHVFCVLDGSSVADIKLYVDGVLETNASLSSRSINTVANVPVRISRGINNRYFQGLIADVRIFNAALDQDAIRKLMHYDITPADPLFSKQVLHYGFTMGQTVNDESPNGYDGTAVGILQYRSFKGRDISFGMRSNTHRPLLHFLQGSYDSVQVTRLALDSIAQLPYYIIERSVAPRYQTIYSDDIVGIDTFIYWNADAGQSVFREDGQLDHTDAVASQGTINIGQLNYIRRFPSVFEIMSFVTPYGIGLDLGKAGETWTFDVTDFTSLLQGKKRFYLSRGGQWQEDMDIRFLFIKGDPSREVLDISQIWPTAYYAANYTQIGDNSTYFPPVDYPLLANGSHFKLRSAITGHGQQGEFIPRVHYLLANGKRYERQVWKQCGSNPIYPQGGTWIYDRAGWCPGMATDIAEYDITADVGDDEVALDYGMDGGSGDSRYIVSNQIVTYGPYKRDLDVAILDVINPSNKIEYRRSNPMCTAPMIRVKNKGAKGIHNIKVEFWVNDYNNAITWDWTGYIYPDKEEIIHLPVDQSLWTSATGTNDVFYAKVVMVNGGQTDEYGANNSYASPFNMPQVLPSDIYLLIRTNSQPQENTITVRNDWGEVVYQSNLTQANALYRDTLHLGLGCHSLKIEDSDGDGMNFWANQDGAGFVRIMRVGGGIISTLQGDFGNELTVNFTVDNQLKVRETSFEASIQIYPNPSNGIFTLEASDLKDAEISVVNALGEEVMVAMDQYADHVFLDLSDQTKGLYFIHLQKAETHWVQKLILH